MSGWPRGHQPRKRGSAWMSAVRYESKPSSIAPSRPCVSGSGPSRSISSSLMPEVRNWAKPPSPFGMPERGVARVHETARDVDEPLQHLLDLEVRRHRQHRVAHLAQRRTESLGHLVRGYVTLETDAGRLIGSRTGPLLRIAVISDIHGNWHAFEAVLADIAQRGVRTRSGASATSSATARSRTAASRRRATRSDLCLLGNHDLAAIGEVDLADLLARRRDERALDDRRARAGHARVPEDARAEGRARGRRALPRQPARPGLGVRAQRAGRAHARSR